MGISKATTQGVAVLLTVTAGLGLGSLLLCLLYANGYECPTVYGSAGPAAAEAVQRWWPMGVTCVVDGVRSEPDWYFTTLVLIGLGAAIGAVPAWARFARMR